MAERHATRRSPPARREATDGATGALGPRAAQLDRLVHERVRLALLGILAVNRSVSFTELRQLLKTTDGNLSVHARKLEDAGYVQCSKTFAGRLPRTEYRITDRGRRALERYIDHMEAVIRAMRGTSE